MDFDNVNNCENGMTEVGKVSEVTKGAGPLFENLNGNEGVF